MNFLDSHNLIQYQIKLIILYLYIIKLFTISCVKPATSAIYAILVSFFFSTVVDWCSESSCERFCPLYLLIFWKIYIKKNLKLSIFALRHVFLYDRIPFAISWHFFPIIAFSSICIGLFHGSKSYPFIIPATKNNAN